MIPRQRESSKAGIFLQVVSRETMPSGANFSHLRSTWNIKSVVQTSWHVTEETRRGRAKVGRRHLMNKGSKEGVSGEDCSTCNRTRSALNGFHMGTCLFEDSRFHKRSTWDAFLLYSTAGTVLFHVEQLRHPIRNKMHDRWTWCDRTKGIRPEDCHGKNG